MYLTIVNSKILNLGELLDYVSASANLEEINSLLSELSAHTKNGTVNPMEARTLLVNIETRRRNLSTQLVNDAPSKKMIMTPNTAVSNRAGIASTTTLIIGLSIFAVAFALMLLSR